MFYLTLLVKLCRARSSRVFTHDEVYNKDSLPDGTDLAYQQKIANWAAITGVGMVHPSQQPWGESNSINY